MKRKVCPFCRGSKKLMGMGMLTTECFHCEGVGYLYEKEPEVKEVVKYPEPELAKEKPIASLEDIDFVKKKLGRPKKKK